MVLTLGNLPAGYIVGTQNTTIVTLESKELISYSFDVDKADVLDRYKLTLTLTGQNSGKSFTATSDLELPIKVGTGSTGTVGKDFSIEGDMKLIVKAGTNSASLFVSSLDVDAGATPKTAVIELDKDKLSQRFLAGNNAKVTLTIKGGLKSSKLAGTYTFKEIPEVDELKFWIEDMGDDPELAPFNNKGYKIEIIANEDGTCTLKPGTVSGDLGNFLRESKFDYTPIFHPINKSTTISDYTSQEPFMWTSENKTLTYFKLEKANRAFSKTKETIGAAVIALSINEDNNLELHLRDYDQPPFMENWWDPSNWDSDMFGFCYVFTKDAK